MIDPSTVWREAREAHYEQHFGPITGSVMRSLDGKEPRVDVYSYPPSATRDHWTLITNGMSDRRQELPEGAPTLFGRRTELLMYAAEPLAWRFYALKLLAEYPFEQGTWIHRWHSVDAGAPVAEGSSLRAFFFLPPMMEDPLRFEGLEVEEERLDFLWVVPITAEEQRYGQENDGKALEDLLCTADFDLLLTDDRASLV